MKRFLIFMLFVYFFVAAAYYLYYIEGYYIPFRSDAPISIPFYADEHAIYVQHDEEAKPIEIKGVEVDSSLGPLRGTDFPIDEGQWQQWFQSIHQMGANTIYVTTVMNDTFYNALYRYNQDRAQPLYVIQGMGVARDDLATSREINQLTFFESLKEDGKDLIDIIHGRKTQLLSAHKGSVFYRNDVSEWVIGFVIGGEQNQDLIAYIDHAGDVGEAYSGTYVTTSPEATNFEILMAQLIDYMVGYESGKYQTQRLISVNSSYNMDPFRYKEHYAYQLGKMNSFNVEHITPTPEMKSGLFVSYSYEQLNHDLLPMIDDERTQHADVSSYLDLLNLVHQRPIVFMSVGHPSTYHVTDTSQSEALLAALQKIEDSGMNGAVIRTWQDVWDRRSVETSYAVDLQQISEWQDLLTATQHFGLLGFLPYRDGVIMEVDGHRDDWKDVAAAYRTDTESVYVTRDHAYVYIWMQSPQITEDGDVYIGLDLHPKLGNDTPLPFGLTFDRQVDFVIHANASEGALVYVQDRYQSIRPRFLEWVTGKNPYVDYPDESSAQFEPVQRLHNDHVLLTEEDMAENRGRTSTYSFVDMKPLTPYEEASDYPSADVFLAEGRLELRLPYQLLNIYDPLSFTIHDDYYSNYGVEPLRIDHFYLQVGTEHNITTDSIQIKVHELERLQRYKQYLKPAYDEVQRYWNGAVAM